MTEETKINDTGKSKEGWQEYYKNKLVAFAQHYLCMIEINKELKMSGLNWPIRAELIRATYGPEASYVLLSSTEEVDTDLFETTTIIHENNGKATVSREFSLMGVKFQTTDTYSDEEVVRALEYLRNGAKEPTEEVPFK